MACFFVRPARLNKKRRSWNALLYPVRVDHRADFAAHAQGPDRVTYGNLYSDLLDYVVFSVLIFYVLTIAGIFVLALRSGQSGATVSCVWLPFRAAACI